MLPLYDFQRAVAAVGPCMTPDAREVALLVVQGAGTALGSDEPTRLETIAAVGSKPPSWREKLELAAAVRQHLARRVS
jgi:hypothetical protein